MLPRTRGETLFLAIGAALGAAATATALVLRKRARDGLRARQGHVYLFVEFTTKDEAAFLENFAPLGEGSSAEAGCVRYDLLRQVDKETGQVVDASKYFLVEEFVSPEAHKIHHDAAHFKQYVPPMAKACASINVKKLISPSAVASAA
mmetsp:Transcript_53796/g.128167  ORF Transcript_53796/g.128167 Transcript_53796/m.128167 type:complete len:148 (+) Transcript_53796:83-526(+)|eukprot:CAMPEP_0178392816 /NCGR_PEP_ID=MMETSP0689_2-20121128/11872_1 /TAXON_ID=160604 /ORGANISM="Amphidinium massartii, Strain CS-259" /LENGTH=147 /DNA_ID=CAMNT_0020013399 /DNA_START=52 /DNA_END=495 /DNA_ORIENTATION=-